MEDGNSILLVLTTLFGVLGLGALIVYGLTSWGKKQDDIDNMMSFCIKYFFDTTNTAEKCNAAAALGKTKNTGALLVLIDVISDEKLEKKVRKAAKKALKEVHTHHRKYRTLIKEITAAIKDKDHQRVVDLLIANFEKNGGGYAQSAYVIGREYIRLDNYDAGREWLNIAQARNQKYNIYGNQILLDIDNCNRHLFDKGDASFKAGDYYSARELYTLASTGIKEEDKKRFAAHLRLACVYAKIGDYIDADQSILQALQHHHRTDLSLKLNKLVMAMLHTKTKGHGDNPEVANIKKQIDICVEDIANKLFDEESGKRPLKLYG